MNDAHDYLVVFEKANDGSYSAYVPDLPGCVSTGDTLDEAEQMIKEAIRVHMQSLREHDESVPGPSAKAKIIRAA